MTRVAINGLGRIGRATLKIILTSDALELVAVNDTSPVENLVYLLRYDTVYGRFDKPVNTSDDRLLIGDDLIPVYHERDPANLPWAEHDVDIVFECTGVFRHRPELQKHIDAGARRVILSAPPKDDDVPMIVHGVDEIHGDPPSIVSTASCTTNCVAPVAEIMQRRVGVKKAMLNTIHAYTSSQSVVDSSASRFERGRAAAMNLVPTSTGAAHATTVVLDHYRERFAGMAVRVPVVSGSLSDLVLVTERDTSVEELNSIFREEASSERYGSILGVSEDPIVSSDIIQDPRAAVVDLTRTEVVAGDLVKVISWYDNEWGYAAQMVRHALPATTAL